MVLDITLYLVIPVILTIAAILMLAERVWRSN